MAVWRNHTYKIWKRERGLCGTRVGRGKVRRGAGSSYNLFNCWNFVGPLGFGGCLGRSLGVVAGAKTFSTEGVEDSMVVVCAESAIVGAMLPRSHIDIWVSQVLVTRPRGEILFSKTYDYDL